MINNNLKIPTNESFGKLFFVIFSVFSIYSYFKFPVFITYSLASMALFFGLITKIKPNVLTPLNKLWMGLGFLLNKIVSPILMGVFFYVLITPLSLFFSLIGRDELRLRKSNKATYWKTKSEINPEKSSFYNQY